MAKSVIRFEVNPEREKMMRDMVSGANVKIPDKPLMVADHYCEACGEGLAVDVMVCTECGAIVCEVCGTVQPADGIVCSTCHIPLSPLDENGAEILSPRDLIRARNTLAHYVRTCNP